MSHLTTSKGITLIELLVIVAILGIFSGIGYVSFTSVDTGSNFRANKETISSYLERIRFKAFSDGKHYKVRLENVGNDMQIKLYQPDSSNIKWRDLNLNRRCNCWSGTGNSDTNCNNAFSNSTIHLDSGNSSVTVPCNSKLSSLLNSSPCHVVLSP
ncbi:MAG: hypothetical protein EBW04_04505, partial [Betaproteobacteria bacterium]|nr:hypothetical protein [Betaproteobacteria bacterium]